jgi:hypothetical protein
MAADGKKQGVGLRPTGRTKASVPTWLVYAGPMSGSADKTFYLETFGTGGTPCQCVLPCALTKRGCPILALFARVGRDAVDRIIVVMPLLDSRGQSPQCDSLLPTPSTPLRAGSSQKAAKDGTPTL